MKNLIKIEEAAMFGFSIVLFNTTDFTWWWYPLLILLPDLGLIRYLTGNRIGAWLYNIFHHKAVAILLLCFGFYIGNEWLEFAGIILFGHSSLDRILGYGLKYVDNFKHRHLGWIGSGSESYQKGNRLEISGVNFLKLMIAEGGQKCTQRSNLFFG